MVKKLYTESYIEDIADAIREKNGSSNTYTVAQMGPAIQAIPTGGGGAISITNGVLESHLAASGTIPANTFVQFGGTLEFGQKTALSELTGSNAGTAVWLSETQFLAIYFGSASGTLYGRVCTVSGSTITASGTETLLASDALYDSRASFVELQFSAVLLSTGAVFIAYKDSTQALLRGVVCTISGTTITVGTALTISNMSYSGSQARAVALTAGKAYVVYQGASGLVGKVCTVSGTTITAGTEQTILETEFQGALLAAQGNNVIIVAPSGDNIVAFLYSTESAAGGTPISLSTSFASYPLIGSIVPLSNNRFLAVFGFGAVAGGGLFTVVLNVSGAILAAGGLISLETTDLIYSPVSAAANGSGEVLATYYKISADYTTQVEKVVTLSVSGTTITVGSVLEISPATTEGFDDLSGIINVAGSPQGKIVAMAPRTQSLIMNAQMVISGSGMSVATTKIEGLTKTAATTTTAGDVWVLNA